MTKKEFLAALKRKLRGLPYADIKERLSFYSEIIEDKMEDGLTKGEAVAEIGDINEIAEQILAEARVEEPVKKVRKPVSVWQIVLIIIGSPIWLSILIPLFAAAWAIIIALWAVVIPFAIMGFIAKYLGIACIQSSKVMGKLTKKCFESIVGLFNR